VTCPSDPSGAPRPVALVTGASSGIGAAFCRRLAEDGYALILVARRRERLLTLAAELQTQNATPVTTVVCDLSASRQLRQLESYVRALPRLDLLVNNAGFGAAGEFAEIGVDRHQAMLDVHIVATTHLTHAALRGMISRRSGAIVNVSSLASIVPVGSAMYCATKAFITVFSRQLSIQLRDTGVRVQALCPGMTVTEFHDAEKLEGFDRSAVPGWLWLSADRVVEESLRDLERGRWLCIPGRRNRFLAWFGGTALGRRTAAHLTSRPR